MLHSKRVPAHRMCSANAMVVSFAGDHTQHIHEGRQSMSELLRSKRGKMDLTDLQRPHITRKRSFACLVCSFPFFKST